MIKLPNSRLFDLLERVKKERELEFDRYTTKFKNFGEARRYALSLAKKSKRRVYLTCSSGFSIVQKTRLFSTAGYYVASPCGTFRWEG